MQSKVVSIMRSLGLTEPPEGTVLWTESLTQVFDLTMLVVIESIAGYKVIA